jgi:SAM-dependent methyltransferase
MFGDILSELQRSYRRRGVSGTMRHAAQTLFKSLLEIAPAGRRESKLKEAKDREFDELYGVETGGIIQLKHLQIPGTNWEGAGPYWASDPDEFVHLLGMLAIRYEGLTFVDFGSGKGRAVMLASELPFKRVIGVEFSPKLHQIARQNLDKFPAERRRCDAVELICNDVLNCPLPEGPTVYYLYNPFGKEVMESVVARLEQAFRERPREMYILYSTPIERGIWDRAACFVKLPTTGNCAIYRTNP